MSNEAALRDSSPSNIDNGDGRTSAPYGGGLDKFMWDMYNAGAAATAQGGYEQVRQKYIGEDTAGTLPEIHFVYPDHGTQAAVDNAIKSAEEEAAKGHVIEKGDTLWDISREELRRQLGHKPTNQEILDMVNAIVKENGIEDPNNVPIGTRILYPQGDK